MWFKTQKAAALNTCTTLKIKNCFSCAVEWSVFYKEKTLKFICIHYTSVAFKEYYAQFLYHKVIAKHRSYRN